MLRRAFVICLLCIGAVAATAQTGSSRLSDKDVERLMKNVNDDAKTFEKAFKKALEKSSIRKTSKEKDAKRLAETFVKQTEGMAKEFDRTKKADTTLPVVYQSAKQIDGVAAEISMTGEAAVAWQKLRGELDQVSQQFGYQP